MCRGVDVFSPPHPPRSTVVGKPSQDALQCRRRLEDLSCLVVPGYYNLVPISGLMPSTSERPVVLDPSNNVETTYNGWDRTNKTTGATKLTGRDRLQNGKVDAGLSIPDEVMGVKLGLRKRMKKPLSRPK